MAPVSQRLQNHCEIQPIQSTIIKPLKKHWEINRTKKRSDRLTPGCDFSWGAKNTRGGQSVRSCCFVNWSLFFSMVLWFCFGFVGFHNGFSIVNSPEPSGCLAFLCECLCVSVCVKNATGLFMLKSLINHWFSNKTNKKYVIRTSPLACPNNRFYCFSIRKPIGHQRIQHHKTSDILDPHRHTQAFA